MNKVATGAVLALVYMVFNTLPAAAQRGGGYIMEGVGNIYEQYEARQQVIEDLRPKRDLWQLDQQRKQQWLEQQDALRRTQQQQQQYQRSFGVANSTPSTYPPVSQSYQQQQARQWQQQSQSRQQALQRSNMQPLPQWGTATSTRRR